MPALTVGRYTVCRVSTAQMMRAILLAKATTATFGCARASRAVSHGPSARRDRLA